MHWPGLRVGKAGHFMASKAAYLKVRVVELVSVNMMSKRQLAAGASANVALHGPPSA